MENITVLVCQDCGGDMHWFLKDGIYDPTPEEGGCTCNEDEYDD